MLVALVLARPALADELATARELEARLEYDQALALVEATLARGGADPARYVELHLLAGRLAAGLDRAQLARDHFARVLAVRPLTTLPDGTSPKITLPFGAEKARAPTFRVELAVDRDTLALALIDSLALASTVRIRTAHAGIVTRPAAAAVSVPGAADVVEVALLDAAGNTLWIAAPPASPRARPLPPPRSRPPLHAWWPTYATIGVLALVAGGTAAVRLASKQDEFDRKDAEGGHDFSELEAIERSGKRWALAANLSFGAALLSGAVAVIVGVRGRGDRDLVLAPTANGAALSGRF